MRDGRAADARGDDPHELEVFATGATIAVTARDTTPHPGADAMRAGYARVRDFHARPGPRPGRIPIPTASTRRGGDADIVRPVMVNPLVACRLAVSGELFDELIPHLHVEHHPGDLAEARSLTWSALLTPRGHRPWRAALHLLGSPSLVVTIIELVPRQRIRRETSRFIEEGVAAIEILAHRLERAA